MEMNYKEIKKEIKINSKLIGIKILWNDKSYSIFAKKAIYNIYQKNYVEGLYRCIDSNIDAKFLKYIPIYNINELKY